MACMEHYCPVCRETTFDNRGTGVCPKCKGPTIDTFDEDVDTGGMTRETDEEIPDGD